MSMTQDLLSLLGGCIFLFAVNDRPQFGATLLTGILLAAACWYGCGAFSRLWNLRYRVTLTHHFLCAVSAVLTLVFVLLFVALRHAREAAYLSVESWQLQINMDAAWADRTYATAWQEVKSLGLENFDKIPPPGMPGTHIPTVKPASIHLTAATYAEASVEHFNKSRPFLSKIVHAQTGVPSRTLDADINSYFATVNDTYSPVRAISLVANQIKGQLTEQLPLVVSRLREIAVGLFLAVQMVPFGLVAIDAYRKLRVAT